MSPLNLEDAKDYVEQNIGAFHQKRIASLDCLPLSRVLRRKNPYLFRAKNMLTAEQIVKAVLDAHISSNEETLFGDWLEEFAIFICSKVFNGYKSGIAGIDLEFDNDGFRHIVSIKSGPNWGNSGQVKKMKLDFMTASRTLRTGNSKLRINPVNGCCYGIDRKPNKGEYLKLCGQKFWEFISGDTQLYVDIVEPLGKSAQQKNEEFAESYAAVINRFTRDFANEFCSEDGAIDWKRLVAFNSSQYPFDREN